MSPGPTAGEKGPSDDSRMFSLGNGGCELLQGHITASRGICGLRPPIGCDSGLTAPEVTQTFDFQDFWARYREKAPNAFCQWPSHLLDFWLWSMSQAFFVLASEES